MYVIEFTRKVKEDQLTKIPKTMRQRILKAIESRLSVSPSDVGKPLVKEWKDHRRIRVGDYRVIYRVLEERVIVLIIEIDHREDIYR